ncbi:MAG TPA: MogA/MoaB family molybdenum cofactor biosynthesis protein [Bryobacteraceae bacterium]|nr:MogA/MoaB family molybdenum cofactor biosynthesis protein [Bryobacteraceae bacterium]
MTLRAAVITVSDSVDAGTRRDASGPAVGERLQALGWQVTAAVVPDEVDRIAQRIAALADSGDVDVIFTTGGTGIAARDVTPEATLGVIEREIPGIAECIRMEGRRATPKSILSRGVAGTRGLSLIVNLPGSPAGAVDSLDLIVDLVPHVVELLHGNTEHGINSKLPSEE